MGNRTQRIFDVFDAASDYLAKESINVNQEQLKEQIESIYSPGPSFQVIFDFPHRRFDQVSSSVYDILGYEKDNFTVEILFESIHPSDIDHVVHSETVAGKFLFEFLDHALLARYKVTYQYRVRDVHGVYRRFLHQAISLSTDDQGKLSKTLINLSDISQQGMVNNKRISFIDIRKQKSYTNVSKFEDLMKSEISTNVLTNREMEILRFISEGFNSKEIANKLFISKHTVRTHRNNILQKTNLKTIPQAVAYYVREGLI